MSNLKIENRLRTNFRNYYPTNTYSFQLKIESKSLNTSQLNCVSWMMTKKLKKDNYADTERAIGIYVDQIVGSGKKGGHIWYYWVHITLIPVYFSNLLIFAYKKFQNVLSILLLCKRRETQACQL